MLELGVFITCGAGNTAGPVYGYPALFRSPSSTVQIDEILVVGAVNNYGEQWTRSAFGDFVEIFAPGVDVSCANAEGGMDVGGRFGTSIGMYTCNVKF
jgi:hypothetical protein